MPKHNLLTSQQVRDRLAEKGYELRGDYVRSDRHVEVFCPTHSFSKPVLLGNLFRGGRMACCADESRKEKLSERMRGSGNHFFGKKHSIAMREAASKRMLETPHPLRGKPRPAYLEDALRKKITGVPRSIETRQKLSSHMRRRHGLFDFIVRKASEGKTAGKPGIFYIVKIDGLLKFGSATTTMSYRLTRMRQKLGPDVELLLHCLVDDAGAYEAAMMNAHRHLWVHGEHFRDEL